MTTENPEEHPTAPTSEPQVQAQAQTPVEETPTERLRPRTGPIIWGALILAFCLFVAQQAIAPGAVDATTWLISGLVGVGALLLVVGIAVLVRGSGRR